jgi:hypothetical protein
VDDRAGNASTSVYLAVDNTIGLPCGFRRSGYCLARSRMKRNLAAIVKNYLIAAGIGCDVYVYFSHFRRHSYPFFEFFAGTGFFCGPDVI